MKSSSKKKQMTQNIAKEIPNLFSVIKNSTSKILCQTCSKELTDNFKTYESSQEKQKEWIEKQKSLEKSRNNEIQELLKVKHKNEMTNCPFSPKIHKKYNQSNKKGKKCRSHSSKSRNHIYQKIKLCSQNYCTVRNESESFIRLQNLKKITKRNNENILQKSISRNYYLKTTVYERLTSDKVLPKKDPSQYDIKNIKSPQPSNNYNNLSFKPIITRKAKNLKRKKETTFSLLYVDAIQRIRDYNRKLVKEKKTTQKESTTIHTNKESNIVLFRKFNREIRQIFSRESGGNNSLNLIQLMSLLTLTGFTDLKTDKDKNLIYDIWHLLKGDEHQGIIFRNIYVFLLSVLGLYFPWMNEESEIKVQELSNLN